MSLLTPELIHKPNLFLIALWAIVHIAALLLVPFQAKAAPGIRSTDNEVKAVLIYNLTKFVTWPSSAFESDSSPLRVCIVDESAISGAFEVFEKKEINGHQIQALQVNKRSDSNNCHLLYIGGSTDSTQSKKVLSSVEKKAILTIGDSPDFIKQGGIIRIVTSGKKLVVEINPATAKRRGILISSKMLGMAKIVSDP